MSFFSRVLNLVFGRSDAERKEPAPVSDDEPKAAAGGNPDEESGERRKWPRVQLDLQARIRFESPEAALRSHTFDISPGGVFLRVQNPRPKGTIVRLMLDIGERRMMLTGEVVRIADGSDGPKGVGVKFTKIRDEDKAFLEEIVAARQSGRGKI